MRIESIQNKTLEKDFLVKFTKKEVDDKKESWLKLNAGSIKVEGFRPGKVPMQILKSRYGAEADKKIKEDLINESDKKIRDENKIEDIANILLDDINEKNDVFEYKLLYDLLPAYELKDLKTLKLTDYEVDIADKDVDDLLLRFQEKNAEKNPADEKHKIKAGDEVMLTLSVMKDKKALEAYNNKPKQIVVGTNRHYFDELEKALIGLKVGDEKTLQLAFSKTHPNSAQAGKKFDFKFKVEDVQTLKLPKLDKAFFKKHNLENLDALKKQVKEDYTNELMQYTKMIEKRETLDALSDMYQFDISDRIYNKEFETIWKQFEAEKKDAEERKYWLTELEGKTDKDIEKEYQKVAKRRVRLSFLIKKLVEEYKINVADQELQNYLMQEAFRQGDNWQEFLERAKNDRKMLQSYHARIQEEKVIKHVHDNADLKKKKLKKDEVYKRFEEIIPGLLS